MSNFYDFKKPTAFGAPNQILPDIGAELFTIHKTRTFHENWDEGDNYANVNLFLSQ